ncbi:GNAT family N-acetyltransferase [Brachybacterium sp. P6-10-X1]|uniref:GNAT family N-acetyltransferase n=1 Tax=Brachybacterium sp. P6-10-X1 TaxID=1903186 RepID=UPI000971AB15|nr:GNAT family N-acetyltransferase [Brachybacterium sp. P6-10-X1]APX32089.1 GNAT family N-acetyltransferase [Brachybacterium sp. P6-10-X1]
MRVRDLTADDYVPYRAMTADAFGGVFEDTGPRPFDPGQTAIGIDSLDLPGGVEGVLAAGARIRHDHITLGGGVVRCGGVGGLAVHPAHRGGGVFRELLTGVIDRCAAESMAASMLYPSNPSIYRRFGYQVVARGERLVVPLVDLQRLPPVAGRRLVPVTEVTLPRLHALYRELTAGENAMLRREGPLFAQGMPGGGWSALLLADESGADHGYLSWTRGSGPGSGLEVHEIFGRTREDRLALLRSLGSWSTVTEEATLRLRTEDPVLDALPGGGSRPAPGPVPLVMMRVIDTAAMLRARRAPAALRGAIRLEVVDDTVPSGTGRAAGRWLVTAADGDITVTHGDGEGDTEILGTVRLDVHAASLLLVGGRTLADARRLDLAARAEPSAEAFLDALLAGPRPSVMDAF